MILSAHQPAYLPWLGLLHKISLADTYCILNTAQFEKNSFTNRNKIKTQNGPIWLTVPVEMKNHLDRPVLVTKIVRNGWNRKHIKSITHAYHRAPYFDEYFPELESLLQTDYDYLADLARDTLKLFMRQLGMQRPVINSSDYNFVGSKTELIRDMCVKLGADTYVFGSLGKDYADVELLKRAGIRSYFQEYVHPQYSQQFGTFEPHMAVIDLLYNEGPRSYEILMSGNQSTPT